MQIFVNLYCFQEIILFTKISKFRFTVYKNTVHKNLQIQTYSLQVIQALVLKIMTPLRSKTFSKGFSYGKRQEKLNGLIMSVCFENVSSGYKDTV